MLFSYIFPKIFFLQSPKVESSVGELSWTLKNRCNTQKVFVFILYEISVWNTTSMYVPPSHIFGSLMNYSGCNYRWENNFISAYVDLRSLCCSIIRNAPGNTNMEAKMCSYVMQVPNHLWRLGFLGCSMNIIYLENNAERSSETSQGKARYLIQKFYIFFLFRILH